MKGKKCLMTILTALVLAAVSVYPAMAASGTKISSVSLRITSDIEAGDDYSDVDVTTNSSKYYIEDFYVTNEPDGTWGRSDRPKIKITLGAEEGEYYFESAFSKSNVSLSGTGAVVSSVSRSSAERLVINVTLDKLGSSPSNVYDLEVYDLVWDEDQGHGYWEECEDAKKYEVKIYRGTSLLNSETLTTTDSMYDFSPYISKSGTYTFKVRGVYNSSNKGDWQESDEWYVDSELVRDIKNNSINTSTPSGSGSGTGAWLHDDIGGWWYCNADRSYTVNNWQYINNKWYYFDERGYMVTGWVLWNNIYYYCGPDGDMWTNSWTPDGYFVDINGVWAEGYRR